MEHNQCAHSTGQCGICNAIPQTNLEGLKGLTGGPLKVLNSNDHKYMKIVEWLYLNDKMHPDKISWREEFVKMLKEVIFN